MQDPLSPRTGPSFDGSVRRRLAAVALVCLSTLAGSGCGSSPKTAYDLSAPRGAARAGGSGQVVVAEPSALQAYESERIAVKDAAGTLSTLPDAQWADRLPRLVQTRLIQTFENGGRARASRPGDGVTPDGQLNLDLRAFQLDTGRGEVVVEIFAKLIDARSGRVARARLFSGRAPVGSANPAEVAPALDRVSSRIFGDIARWVGSGPQPAPPPAAADTTLRTGSL